MGRVSLLKLAGIIPQVALKAITVQLQRLVMCLSGWGDVTFRALSFRDVLREERTRALREFNACHDERGRFCSGSAQGRRRMPESPDRYFIRDRRTVMVPLDQMDTTRARPKGIRNAEKFMRRAYRGTAARRKPISLRRKANGRYEVLDGNSTTAIARRHRWKALPAHLE
jgi:hypothetical protein